MSQNPIARSGETPEQARARSQIEIAAEEAGVNLNKPETAQITDPRYEGRVSVTKQYLTSRGTLAITREPQSSSYSQTLQKNRFNAYRDSEVAYLENKRRNYAQGNTVEIEVPQFNQRGQNMGSGYFYTSKEELKKAQQEKPRANAQYMALQPTAIRARDKDPGTKRLLNTPEDVAYQSEKESAPKRSSIFQPLEKFVDKVRQNIAEFKAPKVKERTGLVTATSVIVTGVAKEGGAFAIGAGSGAVQAVKSFVHPVKTVKSIKEQVTHPEATLMSIGDRVQEKGLGFVAGEFYGMSKTYGVAGSVAKDILPRVSIKSGTIAQEAKAANLFKQLGIDYVGKPETINYTTLGIESPRALEFFAIKKSTPIVTRVSTESATRAGAEIRIQRNPRGQFRNTGTNAPKNEILFGTKQITARVNIEKLTDTKGVPQPEQAVSYTVFNKLLKETPAERNRTLMLLPEIGKRLQYETGLPVKEYVINIEGVKNPKKVTALVEELRKENPDSVLFGSLITKQLSDKGTFKLAGEKITEGFQNIKQGDIDMMFSKQRVEEITPKLETFAKKLQAIGEDIEVSPQGTNVLQFSKGKTKGNKFFEAKSGLNQETLGLDDTAPSGIGGFSFANIKSGGKPRNVKFGAGQAITAGEQTMRKLAGALIVSSGKAAGETVSFSEAGILGRQGNPRGLKDTAGAIQQIKGIAQIKQNRFNPFEKKKGRELDTLGDELYKGYTKPQQADIKAKLLDIIGTKEAPLKIPLSSAPTTKISSASLSLKEGAAGASMESPRSSASPAAASSSKITFNIKNSPVTSIGFSKSYKSITSPSSTPKSPSFSSPSKSPSSSQSVSLSPSPSPRSKSPSTSTTRSPYPSISITPSPSPSLTPSPSPSPSPSRGPGSPGSPFIKTPPPPTYVLTPTRRDPATRKSTTTFKIKKLKQPRAYTPSATSAILNIRGSETTAGIKTGLGIRPILGKRKKHGKSIF